MAQTLRKPMVTGFMACHHKWHKVEQVTHMTFEEIEKDILSGSELPDNISEPERMCRYALTGLYQVFRAGQIDRTEARKRKRDIAENYRRMCFLKARYFAAMSQYQENLRMASKHRYELTKAQTELDALDLALKTLTDMFGEPSVERAVREKLKL